MGLCLLDICFNIPFILSWPKRHLHGVSASLIPTMTLNLISLWDSFIFIQSRRHSNPRDNSNLCKAYFGNFNFCRTRPSHPILHLLIVLPSWGFGRTDPISELKAHWPEGYLLDRESLFSGQPFSAQVVILGPKILTTMFQISIRIVTLNVQKG